MVQAIEKTGKKWKGMMLLGAVATGCGIVAAVTGGQGMGGDTGIVVGIAVAVCGFGLYVFARIGAWWCHG